MIDLDYVCPECWEGPEEPPTPFCPVEHFEQHGEFLFPFGLHTKTLTYQEYEDE